jgi:hypothetical protein
MVLAEFFNYKLLWPKSPDIIGNHYGVVVMRLSYCPAEGGLEEEVRFLTEI